MLNNTNMTNDLMKAIAAQNKISGTVNKKTSDKKVSDKSTTQETNKNTTVITNNGVVVGKMSVEDNKVSVTIVNPEDGNEYGEIPTTATTDKDNPNVVIELSFAPKEERKTDSTGMSPEDQAKIDKMKEFTERIIESNKVARRKSIEDAYQAKMKVLSSMLKNTQMMQSRHFTKDSYKKLINSAKRGVQISKKSGASTVQINRAISELQRGLSGLKTVLKNDERGKHQNLDAPNDGSESAKTNDTNNLVSSTASFSKAINNGEIPTAATTTTVSVAVAQILDVTV